MRDKEIEQLREALRSGQWADLSGGNEVLMIDAKIARAALGGEE